MKKEFKIKIVMPYKEIIDHEELEKLKLEMVLACSKIINKSNLKVMDCEITIIK